MGTDDLVMNRGEFSVESSPLITSRLKCETSDLLPTRFAKRHNVVSGHILHKDQRRSKGKSIAARGKEDAL